MIKCETCIWNGIYKIFKHKCEERGCVGCEHSIGGVCKCESCKMPDGRFLHHEWIPELKP